MTRKLKTLWLNIGMLDRDLATSARLQLLQSLALEDTEVRANFNYIRTPLPVSGLDKFWLLRFRTKPLIGNILLYAEQQLLLMKNSDVDVVVIRFYNLLPSLPLWFLWRKILRRKGPKFVLDVRSRPADFRGYWKRKQRQIRFDLSVLFAFRYFDGITMITEKMKKDLQKKFNNFEKKICVWSSGVDPSLFDPDNVRDFRQELGFKDRFVIMYHGILSPGRGLQQAIEAIALIRKRYPEVILFLLGNGPAEMEIREKVRNLGLDNHVLIHSPVPYQDVPKYIKCAQVGILPFPDLDCWNTSSPIKLCEYLAMRKPVIVTDIAAHRAALGDLECGFFVTDHHPHSLACGIKKALKNKSKLSVFGEIARKNAIERFTWGSQARKIKAYFQDLVKEDSGSSS